MKLLKNSLAPASVNVLDTSNTMNGQTWTLQQILWSFQSSVKVTLRFCIETVWRYSSNQRKMRLKLAIQISTWKSARIKRKTATFTRSQVSEAMLSNSTLMSRAEKRSVSALSKQKHLSFNACMSKKQTSSFGPVGINLMPSRSTMWIRRNSLSVRKSQTLSMTSMVRIESCWPMETS